MMLPLLFALQTADAGAPPANVVPACVQVQTQSRYVPYGYNHIVIIRNGCSRAVTCSVSTDVNPEVQKTEVASNNVVEVSTFLSAASATFTAYVRCQTK